MSDPKHKEVTPKKQNSENSSSSLSPLDKRIKRKKVKPQYNTLPVVWLSKSTGKKSTSTDVRIEESKKTKNSGTNSKRPNKNKTFKRTDSSDSFNEELPSFAKKKRRQRKAKNESFDRYGINLPSADDILKEQEDFDKYKKLVEEASSLKDLSFNLPFSVEKLSKPPETKNVQILDCKHLNFEELEKGFEKHLKHISGILSGKIYSERHDRFYNYNKTFEHTTKDLTYNTSMIVFTFEQKEYLLSLLQKKLDPEDKLVEYFFKVLLPELCLRIFMDAHNMSKNRAVEYLDSRPVVE